MTYSYLFKYTIVGDTGCGKSCLLLQFTDKSFAHQYDVTIGVEFGARLIKIGDQTIKMQIWDTAGQDAFRSITRSYYRGSSISILVYDITKYETFNHIKLWMEEIHANCENKNIMVLVGNKSDLDYRRQVSKEEGEKFANENGMIFFETSAKMNVNVENIFIKPAEQLYNLLQDDINNKTGEEYGVKKGLEQDKRSIKLLSQEKDLRRKHCCFIY